MTATSVTASSPEPEVASRPAGGAARLSAWWDGYWYEPIDCRRLRVFSWIVHATVLVTAFLIDTWVPPHGWAPRSFWQPIGVARILSLPAPTPGTMTALRVVLLVSAVAAILLARPDGRAAVRRAARVANAAVFAAYGLWLVWAFSWSKVDHDRLTIMVALAVLVVVPGVGVGRDRRAGWALRTVQVVFIMAYPLSAASKIQKSGWLWANQATFARAIIRRGTKLGNLLVHQGELLRIGQWAFIALEVGSIAALWRRPRVRAVVLVGIVCLHLFTWLAIGIHFLPHSICLVSFLPLERLRLPRRVAAPGAAT